MKQYQYTNNYYQEKYMSKIMGPNPLIAKNWWQTAPLRKQAAFATLAADKVLRRLCWQKISVFAFTHATFGAIPKKTESFLGAKA